MKIIKLFGYIWLMGLKWFFFRLFYEIKMRIGFFNFKNRLILNCVNKKKRNGLFKTIEITELNISSKAYVGLKNCVFIADHAMKGKLFCFGHEFLEFSENGRTYCWNMNPVTKVIAPAHIPWNRLPDFGDYGDIKLIWESSRFPQVYYFINAFSVSKDQRYADACVDLLVDWCQQNVFPYGPNYKCGQEIAFRLFSWFVAIDCFKNYISKQQKETILENIYISLLRIESNIDYSAKSVKNNHSISEAAGLFVGGLMFPEFPESDRFRNKGLKYLLHETGYQIYNDGSYIQHSMIYERLALNVLSFVILIAHRANFILPDKIIARQKKMIRFLYAFVQPDGRVPNYGSNDGTQLFPLPGCEYQDFRPCLNLAVAVTEGQILFDKGQELVRFFDVPVNSKINIEKSNRFDDGGYYILKDENFFGFVRAHTYKDRPGQSDMFHLDVWLNGENIFCDSGTYSYNSSFENLSYFKGVAGHNTVQVNNTDQMVKVGRFGWSDWLKTKQPAFSGDLFESEHSGYEKRFGIKHRRKIHLKNGFLVEDNINSVNNKANIKQIWNTEFDVEQIDLNTFYVGGVILIKSNIPGHIENGYISRYYNSYEEGARIVFEAETDKDITIRTIIEPLLLAVN